MGRFDKNLEYPEHEKLKALEGANNTVGDFIQWLGMNSIILASWRCPHGYPELEQCEESLACRQKVNDQELFPIHRRTAELIADFFGIDEQALNDEKERMFEEIRADNARS